ncbi:PBP1A family penicillin-binding protein [Candidatus Babeliales bacterium]|nr:PBP1A family penicillin-binding protein [Candidatus Babeliales bacterium]
MYNKKKSKFNFFFNTIFFLTIIFISFFIGIIFFLFEKDWVDFTHIEFYNPGKPSIVLDKDGKELFRFQLDKREPVNYSKLPDILIKAFLAAEDRNFFNHSGISLKGIIRSTLVNLYHRKIVQGASTITQQLTRGLFLSYERTMLRKIHEIFLSLQIERQFTKEQILELYLNNMYFGRGIYGVQTACNIFWNKSVCQITLDQAATLAAVAKSARFYSPLNCPQGAKKRRDIILKSMFNLKFISEENYKNAISKNLEVQNNIPGNPIRLYLQEWIRSWAEDKWGKDILYKKGLKIKTTINKNLQELAENIFLKKMSLVRKKIDNKINGGMISIEAQTGKIRTAIGGYDFKESQYNRCFKASRQVGSTFKTILYSCALQNGLHMYDISIDEPLEIQLSNNQIYKPRNWTRKFDGPMTLLKALSSSNNMIAIKLFLQLGAQKVLNLARDFGITEQLTEYPSSALGTAQATVEQVAAAFNVFANSGIYVKPFLIEWVKNEAGTKLWEDKAEKRIILDSKINSIMINALMFQIKRSYFASNCPEKWIKSEAIGKTGATNKASSMWFVGSTPELTTCVYAGRDDNKLLGANVFSSKITYPIWLEFKKNLEPKKTQFYIDPTLKEVNIDVITGEETENTDPIKTATILI